MRDVLLACRAELFELETALQLLFVLERAIVGVLAHRALELDHVFLRHRGRRGGQKMRR